MILKKHLIFILKIIKNKSVGVWWGYLFDEYNHVVNIINDNIKEWLNNRVRVEKYDVLVLSIQF